MVKLTFDMHASSETIANIYHIMTPTKGVGVFCVSTETRGFSQMVSCVERDERELINVLCAALQ